MCQGHTAQSGFKYECVNLQNSAIAIPHASYRNSQPPPDCDLLGHPHTRISCFLHRFFSQNFSDTSIPTHHIASSGFKHVSVSTMSARTILNQQARSNHLIHTRVQRQYWMISAQLTPNQSLSIHHCHLMVKKTDVINVGGLINQMNKQSSEADQPYVESWHMRWVAMGKDGASIHGYSRKKEGNQAHIIPISSTTHKNSC